MTWTWKCWRYLRWLYRFLVITGIFTLPVKSALAQDDIVPDNTLGAEASDIRRNVLVNGRNADLINGGAIRDRNLFHSFSEFNIKDGQRVYFSNPSGVINILTRVTGGNASNILGTLGVDGTANLFLINPNGILFGQNARLEVRGSFVGTTANGVQFGNQGVFSATNPEAPPLLTVNPSALFFNQINQNAEIRNNSIAPAEKNLSGTDVYGLRVPNGKSLLLVGGNVSMDRGRLNAFGGRVELGGLTETGIVELVVDKDNLNNIKLKFPENVARGDVSLTNKAGVGEGARVDVEGAGGGDIVVYARNIKLSGDSYLSGGIGDKLVTHTRAGDITLNATGDIEFTDLFSKIINDVGKESRGKAGDVNVTAKGNILLLGGIMNKVEETGNGNGGDINIEAGSLTLKNGAFITTSIAGKGNAGNVNIIAKGNISVSSSNISSQIERGGDGSAGSVSVRITGSGNLSLKDGGQILASVARGNPAKNLPPGNGNAGNISVDITGNVDMEGFKIDGENQVANSQISSRLNQGAGGNGGDITIKFSSLNMGKGTSIIASTEGNGKAGNITLTGSNLILLRRGAQITTNAVTTEQNFDGGNINIDSTFIVAIPNENSDITANAFGENGGNGGNIYIKTQGLFGIERRTQISDKSDITASSRRGVQGQIVIDKPDIDPTRDTPSLTSELEPAQIPQVCQGTSTEADFKFTVTGRGGKPSSPNEPLSSNAGWQDLRTSSQTDAIDSTNNINLPNANKNEIVEAQGWYKNSDGEIILTSLPTTVTPYSPWFVPADCFQSTETVKK